MSINNIIKNPLCKGCPLSSKNMMVKLKCETNNNLDNLCPCSKCLLKTVCDLVCEKKSNWVWRQK